MKKNNFMKGLISFTCVLTLLSGCSMFDSSEDKAKDMAKDGKETTDKVKDDGEDTIDNMMDWMKGKGVSYTDMEKIDQMDFAAHEGRSFMYEGNMVYLYRINNEDEKMQQLMKDAKDKKSVKVNVDGEEKEYGAMVNGDYLLIHEKGLEMNHLSETFPSYDYMTYKTSLGNNKSE